MDVSGMMIGLGGVFHASRMTGLICCLTTLFWVGDARPDAFADQRAQLIREIEAMARRLGDTIDGRGFDALVMRAMMRVPRHLFVPKRYLSRAYLNRPLPIGYGQTISQPYIVALMTDLLDLQQGQVALEVGTGSGYQAAVLAELGVRVYTIEIVEPLAKSSAARLKALGYDTVIARWGDG